MCNLHKDIRFHVMNLDLGSGSNGMLLRDAYGKSQRVERYLLTVLALYS